MSNLLTRICVLDSILIVTGLSACGGGGDGGIVYTGKTGDADNILLLGSEGAKKNYIE